MVEKRINPLVKTVLEIGPVLAFFGAYMAVKDQTFTVMEQDYSGFIAVTAGFVPVLLLSIFLLKRLSGRVSRMQVITAVLVIVFGGLTIYLNDERFFKMKTTIVYGLFSVILATGLAFRKSWLAYVMGELMPMRDEGWMILTRRLALAFGVLAAGNEAVWRTMSTEAWVKIETFAFPVALFLFLWVQIMMLQPYFIEEETALEE